MLKDRLALRPGGNALFSDLTPWWWKDGWGTDTTKMLGALRVIRACSWTQEATVSISSDRLAIALEVTDHSNIKKLHDQLGELKLFIDEMIERPAPEQS